MANRYVVQFDETNPTRLKAVYLTDPTVTDDMLFIGGSIPAATGLTLFNNSGTVAAQLPDYTATPPAFIMGFTTQAWDGSVTYPTINLKQFGPLAGFGFAVTDVGKVVYADTANPGHITLTAPTSGSLYQVVGYVIGIDTLFINYQEPRIAP